MIASFLSQPATVRPDARASLYTSPQACGHAASDSGCSTVAAKKCATKITSMSTHSKHKLAVKTPISKPPAKSKLSTSRYRGVTRHSTTGRYEAHLWDSTFVRAKASKGGRTRGKQVYLGGFKCEVQAARAYDVACLKYWGANTDTNFPEENYAQDIADNEMLSRQEVVAKLKRSSNGFARGHSKYRGVTRHHKQGKWEARIGRVKGSKYLYLGTYSSQEEAARAYDEAALKFRGEKAVTNFNLGSSEDETGSSADNSSTSLAAHSSASHQHQASTPVADSSMSAQSMVALSDFTANSPAMQARFRRHNAFQGHTGATAPHLSSTPATDPPEAQQRRLQLNSQPYQQAEMFLGTSTAVSAECDWGYAFRQPCSHSAEVQPCDDFVASMALLMGQDEFNDSHYGDVDTEMFAPAESDPWPEVCHTFMAAAMYKR